ncbi:MAG: undecaprenyl-diphosphate phosphatase [Magnetospirillum sp. WYHS-4]
MDLQNLAILALIQGVTEFLPISSSGHLVVMPRLTCWPDQGLAVDVAMHVGTLGAVLTYFWRDIAEMIPGFFRLMAGRRDPAGKLALLLIVGTVPVVAAGLLVKHYWPEGIRSLAVVAWTMTLYGILLYVADRVGMTVRRVEHLGYGDAVVIGFAQCLALIPGTSRSGITITAARMMGMERAAAARFSMLLSVPGILGAGLLEGYELYKQGNGIGQDAILGAGLAFVAGLVAIWGLMGWLKRSTFTPFVVYRLILGLFLFSVAYGWVDWQGLLGLDTSCDR